LLAGLGVESHYSGFTWITVGIGEQCRGKFAAGFKENRKILFDDFVPKWNYRAVPTLT
jgi:hypothetical protein